MSEWIRPTLYQLVIIEHLKLSLVYINTTQRIMPPFMTVSSHGKSWNNYQLCQLNSCFWLYIVGLGWSYPCDIWSVGCILVELCTVCPYFRKHPAEAPLSILWNPDLGASIAGWSFVSDPRKFRALSHDGEGTWSITAAYVQESWVSELLLELAFNWDQIFDNNEWLYVILLV